MNHTMVLHRWTILLVHFLGNVFAGYSWVNQNTNLKLHHIQPPLKRLWFTNVSLALQWLPKESPSLFQLNVLLLWAWIVFVDNSKTITVIWASVECVCQLPCQVLCVQPFLHSHYSALLVTDFDEKLGQWEGSSPRPPPHHPSPPLRPWPQFTDPDLVCVFVMLLLPPFRFRHDACNHFPLGTPSVQPFLLFLSPHDVKKEKMKPGSVFNNRKQKDL